MLKELTPLNTGKTQLVLFDLSNNTGSIDVKMDGSILEKNYLLRYWEIIYEHAIL